MDGRPGETFRNAAEEPRRDVTRFIVKRGLDLAVYTRVGDGTSDKSRLPRIFLRLFVVGGARIATIHLMKMKEPSKPFRDCVLPIFIPIFSSFFLFFFSFLFIFRIDPSNKSVNSTQLFYILHICTPVQISRKRSRKISFFSLSRIQCKLFKQL